MKVFFYGLFMDQSLLAAKGIEPTEVKVGFVDGFHLRIGERATLVRRPDSRAYGIILNIDESAVAHLYAEESVADYRPEPVTVKLIDGTQAEATCYNLPEEKLTGASKEYARCLLEVATRFEFPDSYLEEIRRARE